MIQPEFFTTLPTDAVFIREEVFLKEQQFSTEFDDIDDTAVHLVLYENDTAIACARYYPDKQSGCFHIGRIAVLPPYRGRHLGSRLLTECEQRIKAEGGHTVFLSAQVRVQPFYEKLGYAASGEIYYDEYCEHIHMEKRI